MKIWHDVWVWSVCVCATEHTPRRYYSNVILHTLSQFALFFFFGILFKSSVEFANSGYICTRRHTCYTKYYIPVRHLWSHQSHCRHTRSIEPFSDSFQTEPQLALCKSHFEFLTTFSPLLFIPPRMRIHFKWTICMHKTTKMLLILWHKRKIRNLFIWFMCLCVWVDVPLNEWHLFNMQPFHEFCIMSA